MKSPTSLLFSITLAMACVGLTARARQAAHAPQELSEAEIKVYFATSKADIDPSLKQNARAFAEIDSILTVVSNDSSWVVKHVDIIGSASPEGSADYNRALSLRRADAISKYFASYTDSATVAADFRYTGADWQGLRRLVKAAPTVPDRDRVISIIDSGTADRLACLKRLSGGATYRWLLAELFPELRASAVKISLQREKAPATIIARPHTEIAVAPEPEPQPQPQPEPVVEPEHDTETPPVAATPEPYIRRMYLKTNAAAWAMAISNVAIEFDIVPHLSATLPLYYSAWDYGSHRVKFRTLAFQPELRLWSRPDNMRWFVGAHFGVAQYNMAIGGSRRYQDHDGHSPALGGGISAGYRRTLGRSGRWMMEFSLGAGAYSLHYDAWDNTTSVAHGQKAYEKRKTFFGIDNVGITFIYSIPLTGKGGSR